ncbi:MAG: phosphoenolpyruvate carboxylase [Bifidobacteriaceae bacterium]|jgi:phosphoenolpyruvate carboxylase|nr:phosphoenolpyruvate carboxylase [Bifidobacteriaceae bacterium]
MKTTSPNTGFLSEHLEYFAYLLNKVLQEYNPRLTKTFNDLVTLTMKARSTKTLEAYQKIQKLISVHSVAQITDLAKALTVYFHLSNLTEELNRIQRLKNYELTSKVRGVNNALGLAYLKLQKTQGKNKALAQLRQLVFHPVLTAHPTEARRVSTTNSIKRITNLILERSNLVGLSLIDNERKLLAEVDLLFRSSPIAPKKPTPAQENEVVLNIFDDTFFDSTVNVYQRLQNFIQSQQKSNIGYDAPQITPFIRLGSWIGSDRDGNPNVTSEVTYNVARQNYQHIVHKYVGELKELSDLLSFSASRRSAPAKVLTLFQTLQRELNSKTENREGIYQSIVLLMSQKLERTLDDDFQFGYRKAEDFLANLQLIQSALLELKDPRAAYGKICHLIWQVETFGFHMVELEVRQHSKVHAQAVSEINKYGLTSQKLSNQTREALEIFRTMLKIQQKYGPKSIGRYIVSFTTSARDIMNVINLATFALQKDFGLLKMDVVPLFETQADLDRATEILDECLASPYINKRVSGLKNRIEVMLGYSDSSKDIGPIAATLKIHHTQAELAKWAKARGIELILFHGRGGALGRGGGPAQRAVLAQPEGTVHNHFKITEQGESIMARYGNPEIAVRHIESVCASTLLSSTKSVEEHNRQLDQKYQELAEHLVTLSTETYRSMINQPGFPAWFTKVTPLEEIGLMPIGSRAIRRGLSVKEIEDLRAIPWVFSWSQARINLAAWYGFGSACEKFVKLYGTESQLMRSYKEWNFFTTLVDNIEMSLAKTDENIARLYMDLTKPSEFSQQIFHEMKLTKRWVKKLTQNSYPLQSHPVLGEAIKVRGPYVDALSLIQVNALKKIRHMKSKGQRYDELLYLILCTVSGVAAGLQNTG